VIDLAETEMHGETEKREIERKREREKPGSLVPGDIHSELDQTGREDKASPSHCARFVPCSLSRDPALGFIIVEQGGSAMQQPEPRQANRLYLISQNAPEGSDRGDTRGHSSTKRSLMVKVCDEGSCYLPLLFRVGKQSGIGDAASRRCCSADDFVENFIARTLDILVATVVL